MAGAPGQLPPSQPIAALRHQPIVSGAVGRASPGSPKREKGSVARAPITDLSDFGASSNRELRLLCLLACEDCGRESSCEDECSWELPRQAHHR